MERQLLNKTEMLSLFAQYDIDAKLPRPGYSAFVGNEKIILDVQRVSKTHWLVKPAN